MLQGFTTQHEIKRYALNEMMPLASLNEIRQRNVCIVVLTKHGAFHVIYYISFTKGEFHSAKPALTNFIANNLRLFACFLNRNSDRYGHTNHRIISSSDQAHHLFAVGSF